MIINYQPQQFERSKKREINHRAKVNPVNGIVPIVWYKLYAAFRLRHLISDQFVFRRGRGAAGTTVLIATRYSNNTRCHFCWSRQLQISRHDWPGHHVQCRVRTGRPARDVVQGNIDAGTSNHIAYHDCAISSGPGAHVSFNWFEIVPAIAEVHGVACCSASECTLSRVCIHMLPARSHQPHGLADWRRMDGQLEVINAVNDILQREAAEECSQMSNMCGEMELCCTWELQLGAGGRGVIRFIEIRVINDGNNYLN